MTRNRHKPTSLWLMDYEDGKCELFIKAKEETK